MKINTEKRRTKVIAGTIVLLATMMFVHIASAGVLNPDCTASKAAKSAAAKAAIGVGGRCSPAEAAKDTAKKATGIEGKVPSGKSADLTKGAVKAVLK